jgi:hypothetical protein
MAENKGVKKTGGAELEAKQQAANAAMQQIKDMYGDGAIMKFGEAQNSDVDTVPTGCLSLDLALGVGGAPYGGPPNGTENVYVFRWDNHGDRGDETTIRLEQFTRHEASKMRGLSPVAALPTGLILYDMRAFNLIEPSALSREEVLEKFASGEMTKTQALAAMQEGWFAYEWKTGHASEKASTEDVQNTRDISLVGQTQLGYNPVLCAWNSWIGHWKPWNVGRPKSFGVEHISGTFRRAVEEGRSERTITVDFSRHFPQPVKRCDTPTPVACQ